jgi:hypothetical protein
MRALLLLPLAGLLTGCIVASAAHTATDVAMAPVHAAGWTYDRMTTSQAEADRNRGRAMRRQEERDAKQRRREERDARRQAERDSSQAPY